MEVENYKEIISAIEHLDIGYAIFQDFNGKEGVFRVINTALTRKIGYSSDELIDKVSFTELLSPECLEVVKNRYRARLKGEKVPSRYKVTVFSKDGKRIIFDSYIQRIFYEGRPATFGFYIDITDRELMEEEMRANLERQKELITALNFAPESIVITDSDGVIRYVNPAFVKMTGYNFDEVVGKKPNILKSGKQDQEFYKRFWTTISSGKVWKGKFINKKKDGTFYKDYTVVSPVFDERGKITSYIAIKRDVTKEEKFNEQLFHNQKMDAIGLLASGVAHDFNNILGGILGYVELLKMKYKDDDYIQNILTSVEKAGDRAKKLIERLLSFSRKKEEKRELIDVNSHIRNVIDILSRTMPKNVKIILNLDDRCPLQIVGNPTQIEQVIMNVCINAFQAMKETGGELIIYTKKFFPDEEFLYSHYGFQEREYILISISDTGCGMDEETKKRIFDPFFSTKDEGTGLGLSVAYSIVEAHNGKILVYSEKGKGTTFNIYLPATEDREDKESYKNNLDIIKGKGTILVIDDELIIREMLKDVLDLLGYEALFAENGEEGIKKFKEYIDKVDLVVVDMNMPGIGGKKVVEKIRELKPGVKIVFTSGFSLNGMLEEILNDKRSMFLHKPFTLEEFSETLNKLLKEKG